MELVINKNSKLKANNIELISVDYINNYELYPEDVFNKTKEIHKSSTTEIKNNVVPNKLYISNIESNNILLNVYPHLSNNVVVKSPSNKTSEIFNGVSISSIIYISYLKVVIFYIYTKKFYRKLKQNIQKKRS